MRREKPEHISVFVNRFVEDLAMSIIKKNGGDYEDSPRRKEGRAITREEHNITYCNNTRVNYGKNGDDDNPRQLELF